MRPSVSDWHTKRRSISFLFLLTQFTCAVVHLVRSCILQNCTCRKGGRHWNVTNGGKNGDGRNHLNMDLCTYGIVRIVRYPAPGTCCGKIPSREQGGKNKTFSSFLALRRGNFVNLNPMTRRYVYESSLMFIMNR